MAELLLLLRQKVDMMVTFFKVNTEYSNPLSSFVFPSDVLPVCFLFIHIWKCLSMQVKKKTAEHWKM